MHPVGNDAFKLTLQTGFQKFPFFYFALVNFPPLISEKCSSSVYHWGGVGRYFWDQDPVMVLLQMYNIRLNGPQRENET